MTPTSPPGMCHIWLVVVHSSDSLDIASQLLRLQELHESATMLSARYQRSWALDDIHGAVQALREYATAVSSFSSTPVESRVAEQQAHKLPDTIRCRVDLASALRERYRHIGDMADWEEATNLLHSVIAESPETSITAHLVLGSLLVSCYQRPKDASSLRDGQAHLQIALMKCLPNYPSLGCVLAAFGRCMVNTYKLSGKLADLDKGVGLLEDALVAFPESDPSRYDAHYLLGVALRFKYRRDDEMSHLYKAIEIDRSILRQLQPTHRDLYLPHNGLASSLVMLFDRTDNIRYLDESIDHLQSAKSILMDDHPHKSVTEAGVAICLSKRYHASGDINDLNLVVSSMQFRLARNPTSGSKRRLALLLLNRYNAIGSDDDLDEAIRMLRDDINTLQSSEAEYNVTIGNLVSGLISRYKRNKRYEDVKEATKLCQGIPNAAFEGKDALVFAEHFFAALRLSYEETGSKVYLIEAIELRDRLREEWERNPPSRAHRMFSLLSAMAHLHLKLFHHDHDTQVLATSIELYREALASIPLTSVQHDPILIGLSVALRAGFETGFTPIEDLQESLRLLQLRIVHGTQTENIRLELHFELAHLYLVVRAPFYDAKSAILHLSHALCTEAVNAQIRLAKALPVLNIINCRHASHEPAPYDDHRNLLKVYANAISLLPQVAYFGLDDELRLRVLASSDKMAVWAAAHALVDQRAEQAVQLLEQGRAVFWLQYLQTRTALDSLPPTLAEDLRRTAEQLERGRVAQASSPEDDSTTSKANRELKATEQRRLFEEYAKIIRQTRKLPGLKRFLLPETFSSLSTAAERFPVAILLATERSGWIILLERPGVVRQLHLPSVTSLALEALAIRTTAAAGRRSYGTRERTIRIKRENSRGSLDSVLGTLWDQIRRPLVDILPTTSAEQHRLPRLTLCPTGAFTRLPLHAAGLYASPNQARPQALPDLRVVSYTPTIGVLLQAQRTPSQACFRDVRVLLSAVTRPYTGRALLHAAQEIEAVRVVMQGKVGLEVFSDAKAHEEVSTGMPTVEAISQTLSNTSVLHLACHGYQNTRRPLESGFMLADGMLTVSKLTTLKFSHPILAFLSACETARGDKLQPNQAIQMAATMLFSGFRSVIGTLWYGRLVHYYLAINKLI